MKDTYIHALHTSNMRLVFHKTSGIFEKHEVLKFRTFIVYCWQEVDMSLLYKFITTGTNNTTSAQRKTLQTLCPLLTKSSNDIVINLF